MRQVFACRIFSSSIPSVGVILKGVTDFRIVPDSDHPCLVFTPVFTAGGVPALAGVWASV